MPASIAQSLAQKLGAAITLKVEIGEACAWNRGCHHHSQFLPNHLRYSRSSSSGASVVLRTKLTAGSIVSSPWSGKSTVNISRTSSR